MSARPDFCKGCPIGHVTQGYVSLQDLGGNTLIVGDQPRSEDAANGLPHSDGVGNWLYSLLGAARIDKKTTSQVNCIGCASPKVKARDGKWVEGPFPGSKKWTATPRADARAAIEYCREHHLKPALRGGKWSKIYALGENALQATSPRFGITFWRGSALPLRDHIADGPKVIATLSPLDVMKNANMFSVVAGDLKKGLVLPPEFYNLRPSIEEVRALDCTKFSFDLEWNDLGEPTICGITDRYYHCTVVPWSEPYLYELRRLFRNAVSIIGHNIIGADLRYVEDLMGHPLECSIEDTILKQHLVQPDMRHSLATVASIFTSKVFWKGKWDFEGEVSDDSEEPEVLTGTQWRTWDTPQAILREFGGYGGCDSAFEAFRLYNARDTDAQFQSNFPLDLLLKQHGLESTYRNVSIPAAYLCREMGDTGIKIDHTPQFVMPERGLDGPVRIGKVQDDLTEQIRELEQSLPEELRSREVGVVRMKPTPPNTYKPASKKCKGSKKAKNAHPVEVVTFYEPGEKVCPVCGTAIKSPKMTPMKTVKVMESELVIPWNSSQQLQAYATGKGCKDVVNRKTDTLTTGAKARKVWGRDNEEFLIIDQLKKRVTLRNNFAKPGLLQTDRVTFNLLVFGTATGRLSCTGRAPAKLNLQNQPESIKHIFVPDKPGYSLLEIDFSGGDNNLAAFLAKDYPRLERLRTPGFNEHCDTASLFFNQVVTKKDEKLYKAGKIFGHGKTYGMKWRTMQENFLLEGFSYSKAQIDEFDRLWRERNAGTAAWMDATIALAGRQGFLRNPFGRMRWFQSSDFATKALAFLPSSTLADICLRAMIAIHATRFAKELNALGVRVRGDLPAGWRMALQVHDSILLTGPTETLHDCNHLVTTCMTQEWAELDGFALRVASKASESSWGDMKPLAA